VQTIFGFAHQLPDVSFLVLGSVGLAFQNEERPPNVGLLGVLDDQTKDATLGLADVALNPMLSGSGTNLKMLDYLAAGIPVISTPYGARGLQLESGRHLEIAPLEEFPKAILNLRRDQRALEARIRLANTYVRECFDWKIIGRDLAERIRLNLEEPTRRNGVGQLLRPTPEPPMAYGETNRLPQVVDRQGENPLSIHHSEHER
jgi:glycosyltransferase involved in cell wall biosynthesis